jgi:hypothetical protein
VSLLPFPVRLEVMATKARRTWNRADIITALRLAAEYQGRPPGKRDWHYQAAWEEPRRPCTPTVLRHFGSWNAALEAAGLRPQLHSAWSRTQIVEAIRAWVDRTETMPTHSAWRHRPSAEEPDRPTAHTVIKHFGSWEAALRAAGLEPPKPRRSWSATEVVEAIKAFAEREGRPPTGRDWRSSPAPGDPRPTDKAVVKCFGSWNDGLAAAGFAPHRRDWSREEIVAALREFAQRHGKTPMPGDWTRASLPGECAHPSWQAVVNHFGSWDEALRAAGFEPPPRPPRRSWSATEIIASIRAFAEPEGEPPKATDWKHLPVSGPSRPNARAVEECFGSWSKGIEAAGFSPRQRRWSRDEIIAALREFARCYGESPRASEWKHVSSPSEPAHPTRDTVREKFGSWRAALEAAGLRPSRT